uniref:Uncharacterized protein n=1 Tax=Anguilla anguilla TaxID=7936 RepID=A0A0E9R543_ANGAN
MDSPFVTSLAVINLKKIFLGGVAIWLQYSNQQLWTWPFY